MKRGDKPRLCDSITVRVNRRQRAFLESMAHTRFKHMGEIVREFIDNEMCSDGLACEEGA